MSFTILINFIDGGITGLAVYQPRGAAGSPSSDSNPQFNGTDQNANYNGSSLTVSQNDGDSTALEQNLTQESVSITIVASDFDPGSVLSGNYSFSATTGSEAGIPFNGTNATSDAVLGETAAAMAQLDRNVYYDLNSSLNATIYIRGTTNDVGADVAYRSRYFIILSNNTRINGAFTACTAHTLDATNSWEIADTQPSGQIVNTAFSIFADDDNVAHYGIEVQADTDGTCALPDWAGTSGNATTPAKNKTLEHRWKWVYSLDDGTSWIDGTNFTAFNATLLRYGVSPVITVPTHIAEGRGDIDRYGLLVEINGTDARYNQNPDTFQAISNGTQSNLNLTQTAFATVNATYFPSSAAASTTLWFRGELGYAYGADPNDFNGTGEAVNVTLWKPTPSGYVLNQTKFSALNANGSFNVDFTLPVETQAGQWLLKTNYNHSEDVFPEQQNIFTVRIISNGTRTYGFYGDNASANYSLTNITNPSAPIRVETSFFNNAEDFEVSCTMTMQDKSTENMVWDTAVNSCGLNTTASAALGIQAIQANFSVNGSSGATEDGFSSEDAQMNVTDVLIVDGTDAAYAIYNRGQTVQHWGTIRNARGEPLQGKPVSISMITSDLETQDSNTSVVLDGDGFFNKTLVVDANDKAAANFTGEPYYTKAVYLSSNEAWSDQSCLRRIKLTFSQINSDETLADFTSLVTLTPQRINYSSTGPEDFRFYDSGNTTTTLFHHIEKWNESGSSYIWVKVPELDGTGADSVYGYFNCSNSVSTDLLGTYGSNHTSIWHLNETGTGTRFDVFGRNNLTPQGFDGDEAVNGGKIDGGIDLDGGDEYLNSSDHSSLDITGDYVITMWINPRDIGNTLAGLFGKVASGSTETTTPFQVNYDNRSSQSRTNALVWQIGQNNVATHTHSANEFFTVGEWTHVALVVNGTTFRSFRNGELHTTTQNTGVRVTNNAPLTIGRHLTTTNTELNGILDEIALYNGTKSAHWVNVTYKSQADALITYGGEEKQNSGTSSEISFFASSQYLLNIHCESDNSRENVYSNVTFPLVNDSNQVSTAIIAANVIFCWNELRDANNQAVENVSTSFTFYRPDGTSAASENQTTGSDGWTTTFADKATEAPAGTWLMDGNVSYYNNTGNETDPVEFISPYTGNLGKVCFARSKDGAELPKNRWSFGDEVTIRCEFRRVDEFVDTRVDSDNNDTRIDIERLNLDGTHTTLYDDISMVRKVLGKYDFNITLNSSNGFEPGLIYTILGNAKINSREVLADGTFEIASAQEEMDPISQLTCSQRADANEAVYCSFTSQYLNGTYANSYGFNYNVTNSSEGQVSVGTATNTNLYGKYRFSFTPAYADTFEVTIYNATLNFADTVQVQVISRGSGGLSSGQDAILNKTLELINSTLQKANNQSQIIISDFGELTAGSTYRAKATILDFQGKPKGLDTTPTVRLYDPLRNVIVQDVAMSLAAPGVYEYTYNTSGQTAGVWETIVNVTVNSTVTQLNDYWELESSPAQVLINSITDDTVPSITADVTITNEGTAAFEYQYEYCLVSEQSNQCGGGDDLAYASAAKLIVAGTDFDTELSLSGITQTGTLYFKLVVYFGTEKSGATRSFTASEEESAGTPTGAAAAGGGGGGGGGGGTRVSRNVSEEAEEAPVPEIEVIGKEGKLELAGYPIAITVFKSEKTSQKLKVRNSGAKIVNNVQLLISGIPLDKVSITPEKFESISPGEAGEFQIEFDDEMPVGAYDIKLSVFSDQGAVSIDGVLVIKEPKKKAEAQALAGAAQGSAWSSLLISPMFIVTELLLIIIVLLLLFYRRRRRE